MWRRLHRRLHLVTPSHPGEANPPHEVWRQTTVVVPFRLGSTRFPNKALTRYKDAPLLTHGIRNALALGSAGVIVTGPEDDLETARRQGVDFRGTLSAASPASCKSATERVLAIRDAVHTPYTITLPVDEPEVQPSALRDAFQSPEDLVGADAVTFWCPFFSEEDYLSPLSAKIITDRNRRILYMSRAGIPVFKSGEGRPENAKKNVGVFVFPRAFLDRLADCNRIETTLDTVEGLEQLRWLELGFTVRAIPIRHIGFGIDAPEQVALLEKRCGR